MAYHGVVVTYIDPCGLVVISGLLALSVGSLQQSLPKAIGGLLDLSDAQWRNFYGNLSILSIVLGLFSIGAITLRSQFCLKRRGMSIVWIFISFAYVLYLHGACVAFVLAIASVNFFLAKNYAKSRYYLWVLWIFNVLILIVNRIYEGYSFSSFGYCPQERSLHFQNYSFSTYMAYLLFAPLYIAGPIISFNAFASQLDEPQKNYSLGDVAFYGLRWIVSFILMEIITHFFYYNAFANSDLWRQLSPLEIFFVGYGVINFVWLKFLLIWRYFRFWSLVVGVETIENMPKCINNCCSLETFWKSWHASFNKWIVRYMYIPLGGSQKKLLSVWIIFTFVAIWHDLEWKLISWAWLTCLFLVPELVIKSAANSFKSRSVIGKFMLRELSAVAGAITITCLMIANLVGYVIGPSGTKWLISRLVKKDGLPVLGFILFSFYVAVKLMFHYQRC
ncbi:hypothetical protein AXF42_Ash009299 [Apostasia shenzhenica]|uniref:Membrane-bound O-acyltransferase C24H6.01c n=1 Tax=Apostasia shenzhenica TaxID=1088818 RepID=A0A2I0B3P2_9ASPA|nr:hypothetical protein AXF42_Ash009299 [Apostasia shenzhenica]